MALSGLAMSIVLYPGWCMCGSEESHSESLVESNAVNFVGCMIDIKINLHCGSVYYCVA